MAAASKPNSSSRSRALIARSPRPRSHSPGSHPRAGPDPAGSHPPAAPRCVSPGAVWSCPPAEAGQDLLGHAGPAPDVVLAEGRGAQEARGQPRLPVHPQEGAGLAEGPEGLRRGIGTGPVRVLLAADLVAQSPVVGLLAAVAVQDPGQSRELDGGG